MLKKEKITGGGVQAITRNKMGRDEGKGREKGWGRLEGRIGRNNGET